MNISHFLSYFSVVCGLPRDYKGGEKGMQIRQPETFAKPLTAA
ncbi:hypothetical protein GCWU000324_00709 [Kingella oralis ATCC 51147]|uniref:Uncharacterized protein n=1 Tax=Kingella oralis ATCC 51147 TaxID=629741 RepID=C4GEZ9_9NEIS|nr:hypothetical protein GCWU000324_00709 [Kingella oralis ATCC 51147]